MTLALFAKLKDVGQKRLLVLGKLKLFDLKQTFSFFIEKTYKFGINFTMTTGLFIFKVQNIQQKIVNNVLESK